MNESKQIVRKTLAAILSKILLLAGVLVVLNFIYINTFWKSDLFKQAQLIIDLWQAEDSADVIYFGESSDFNTDENDSLKYSISKFTSEYFPKLKFGGVLTPAIHARTYLDMIKNIKTNSRAKTLIVTMNMRSFNADWINSNLETPLMKSEVMYKRRPPIINRLLLSLNAFDNKTEEQREDDKIKQWKNESLKFPYPFPYTKLLEWDSAHINDGWLKPDGSPDVSKNNLPSAYIRTYAFQIDTIKNPRIKDFDEIVKQAKKKNLNLVFNLLSENIHYADSLVGKDLVFLMRQNRDLLMNRYNKDGVIVVDNLELVDGNDFSDKTWTTEHYNQRGRQRVAKNIAVHLQKIYPGYFVDREQK